MIHFFKFFQDNVSGYSPGCPGTILVEQAVHKLKDPPTCLSPSAGVNVALILLNFLIYFNFLHSCSFKHVNSLQGYKKRALDSPDLELVALSQ